MTPSSERGSDYLYGGPVMMQRVDSGPLEWCVFRQNIATGERDVRPVPRAEWPTGRDPREAFDAPDKETLR